MRWMMGMVVVGLPWVAVSSGGCQDCTLIGDRPSVEVDIALPEESGTYTLAVSGDVEWSCSIEVGEEPADTDDTDESDDTDLSVNRCTENLEGRFDIGLVKGDYSIALVDEDGTELMEAELASSDFTTWRPNGRGCAPVSDKAVVVLAPRTAG